MRPVALLFCTFTALLFSVVATPVAQAGGPRLDRGERGVVRAINKARGHHGIKRLKPAPRLAVAADVHTRNMLVRNYFSHGAFAQRVRRYVSFRRIVRMWLNSPGHRAVLLSRGYHRVGVGRRKGRLGSTRACVVTADFGSRR